MKKAIIVIVSVIIIILGILISCTEFWKTVDDEDIDRQTNSIEEYGKWYGLLGHTNLLIFPEKILDSASDAEYSYCNDGSAIAPSCHVFLMCTYNEKDFANELKRVESISNIKYDKTNYPYEAYVSVRNGDENEYVLITGNNSMVYVYYRKGVKEYNKIDKKYMMKETSNGKSLEQFTIYNIDNYNDYKYWPNSWK